jgi:hypothetical protein
VNKVESDKLKRCPFCGDIAELSYDILSKRLAVECTGCFAIMIGDVNNGTDSLVEQWNTRYGEEYE